MKVKYTLYNGTPPFTVTLQSSSLIYTNNHSTTGTYSFDDVLNGTYELRAVDSTGTCEYDYGQVVIENQFIYLSSTTTEDIQDAQDIGDITIESLSRKYFLTLNPKFPDGAEVDIEFGYSLITEESPVDSGDDVYALSSIESIKNGVVEFQEQATSNGVGNKSGSFIISGVTNGDLIEFSGSIIKRSNVSEGKTSSGFFEIYPISVSASVTIVATSFNINGNIA